MNWILKSNRAFDKLDWMKLLIMMLFIIVAMGIDHLYLGGRYIVFGSVAILFVVWRIVGFRYAEIDKERRIENDLDEYEIEEQRLIKDIEQDKITFGEATERCTKLWGLIPSNYTVSPFRLTNLMKEKYSNNPDWDKEIKTYYIPIGDGITLEEVLKLIKKFKDE